MNITGNDPAAGAEHTGYRWVGTSVPRREDPRFLTGRGGYVGDLTVPGMLHGAVLRSPHAHARIRSIDTSAARALPGVVAVLTGEEALAHVNPMPAFCAEPVPQHAITVERVRFPGEAVAAVAATDRYIAEDACALIEVDYELAPARRRPRRGDGRRAPPACTRRWRATWCSTGRWTSATSTATSPAPSTSCAGRPAGTGWAPSRSRPPGRVARSTPTART